MLRSRPLAVLWLAAVAAPAQHWAYRPVVRPELPAVADEGACLQPLDRFVQSALAARGLQPAPAASRATWLRRASLDLCGLPPSPAEVAAFEADASPDAFERQVDRLLSQPAFGERWALWWLDLARYADSQGYEKDGLRPHMWRWRDWVIAAFARDLPFDQFTQEQLAGDLLPEPALEQRIATAFHRHTMTNTEGGTDDEEFRTAAVIDRVNTTMTVWMGSTLGCAQCHDHKFDSFSQREYFQLFAFFDQTEDRDRDDEAPALPAPTPPQGQRMATIDAELASWRERMDAAGPARAAWVEEQRQQLAGFAAAGVRAASWRWLGPIAAASFDVAYAQEFEPERMLQLDQPQEGQRWLERPDLADGTVHEWRGDATAVYLHRAIDAARPVRAALHFGSDDALKVWWNGQPVLQQKVVRKAEPEQAQVSVELRAGRNELLVKVANRAGIGAFWFELRATPLPAAAEAVLRSGPAATGDEPELRAAFLAHAGAADEARGRIAALQRERDAMAVPMLPVLRELPAAQQRTTRVHLRGSFRALGDVVSPAVPACWPPLPAGAPRDRLGLARWLVSRENPLTARVQVNRVWEQLFGRGLVSTGEDFGRQGELPTHRDLLDWLACDFMDDGWSWQRLLRRIVLSATYRQASDIAAPLREQDRDNVWLARGPSFRLAGEVLRDQALLVSGLLQPQVGGPSVMPAQPDGIWGQIYSGEKWQTSVGAGRHRRSLYTFWRRTSPHPAMTTFDAPSREYCVVRRVRTNTPLQALVTWNDPQFVECAEALAARVRQQCPGDDAARLEQLFRVCLLRAPDAQEQERLLAFVRGELAAGGNAEEAERRAWQRCASVVLNLDEFLTKG